jgi:polyisoprenoid-binding protein YceI
MRRLMAPLIVLITLMMAGPAVAAPRWQFDYAHCQVAFTVKHIFAPVMGRFTKYGGSFIFDPTDLAGSKMVLVVQTASIDTDLADRDKHLRSPDFFDVKRYPEMRFVSERLQSKGGNRYVAHGTLTIKDVSKKIELPFVHLGTRAHPMQPKTWVAGFEASYELDRLAYHVGSGKYYDAGVVGNKVTLFFHLEMLRPQKR